MTDRIRLLGVRAKGFHGVFDQEKRAGQDFVVDVELELDLSPAGRTDELADTVSYADVAAAVVRRVEGPSVDLIERLAALITQDALADPRVHAVTVTVHKPQAPVGVPFGDVQVVVRRERGIPVVVAVGANLGDAAATLTAAVAALGRVPGLRVTAASPLVQTDPVGGPAGQSAYLNAVVLGGYAGEPDALLRELHAIEHSHGRSREVHWGPRTLDLDLVQFGVPGTAGERLCDEPRLRLPHPRAAERAFVLVPWAAADPGALLRTGATVADPVVPVVQVLAGLDTQGVRPGPAWAPQVSPW